MIAVILLINLVVGILIGISGIAGFLIPITLNGFLGMPLTEALALSFISFLTSGILGALAYMKQGHLDFGIATPLCIGSLFGAFAGVQLNLIIPVDIAKILLYSVVLFSGISLIVRRQKDNEGKVASNYLRNKGVLIIMGFATAAICSLTGAGGPVLMVPLLASLGVNLRMAVGISLLDSIAIALPAFIGYFGNSNLDNMMLLAVVSVAAHGVGVLAGANFSGKINLKSLKYIVAGLAISSSCYMLAVNLIN
ncbi:sulfite exporter TauE/SafE family protein [Acidaminobacter hydrogenoformans]|uniref:Probable membrane transporter protein n=1 Tax=Acidaminobacter hydrogenoformans DSM 2784 TaxID=1120920 RepID=A0A1G5S125_9FIRM|nr:sulfite exporter TauE/SafE family protein [Acidaminobacter hydrogenoformans]SCZ80064.1 hypothetical protein SAMN03080599_02084 [Acidaminobacter hydrogenoformans DSM 2784]